MASSVKDPILIESDDEDEEVVYIGTSQKSPEVVDVEAIQMETYTVIDVDEQPDTPDASPGVAMDCDQFSAPSEGSLEAGSPDLDSTLLDISQATLPPHSNSADLLSSNHLGLDPLGSLDPLGALDPSSFSLSPAGMGLDTTSLDAHRTPSVVPGGAADLTNSSHNSVAMDLTSGILDPTSSNFGASNKRDSSLKAPLQGSLSNLDDLSSALDLRQRAVDLRVSRSDAAPLTGSSKPLDLNFPDSMTIYPSFYVDDDKSSFLFGSGSTALTNIPQNGFSVSPVNIASSQNLPMASSVTCPPVVTAALPHSLKASTSCAPPPSPTVLSVPSVAPVPASNMMALCPSASQSNAFSQFVQNSAVQSSMQGMASLQSASVSPMPFLNPSASQSSMLVAVPVSSVQGGFLQVPPLPAPLPSLLGSSPTTGPLPGSSLSPVPPATGRDTTDLSSGPLTSTDVFWSSNGGGMTQGSSVSSVTNAVVVTAAKPPSFIVPGRVINASRESTATSQASAPYVVSSTPFCSTSPFGLQATGQSRTSNSPPSTNSSSGTTLSFSVPGNAASSSSASTTAGGSKDRNNASGWDVLDFFGDLFQVDLNKSSTSNASNSHQPPLTSSGTSAGIPGGMASTSNSDPRKPSGVNVPSSQSGCGNTSISLSGSAQGMSNIQVQPSPVMNSSAQTSAVPMQPVNILPGVLSVSMPLRYSYQNKSSTSQFLSVVPSLASTSLFASPTPGAAVHVNLKVSSSPSSSLSVSSSSVVSGSTLGVQGNQPSSSSRLPVNSLPHRKRKYLDLSQGSSGTGPPAKRSRSTERMLCAGCYVSTRDWDRVLQCPQGHLACSSCLQRQNFLFLQNQVEKLCCFDVTCSHIFGNNLVQRMVGTEDGQRDESEENKEAKSFVTSNVNKSLETPLHWAPMKEKATRCVMVDLVPDTDEYNHVLAMFRETLSFKIKKIVRVQNPILWRYYNMKKVEMTHDHQDIVDERLLFHGTKDMAAVQNICEKGFDWRFCGKHGTLYGQGSYFAAKADYSHQYSTTNRNRLRGSLGSGLLYVPPPAHLNLSNFSRLLCGSCLTRGNPLSFVAPSNLGAAQSLSMALGSGLVPSSSLAPSSSYAISGNSSSNVGSGNSSSSSSSRVPYTLQLFSGNAPLSTGATAGQGPARSGTSSQLSAGGSNSSLSGPAGFLSGSSSPSKALLNPAPVFPSQATPSAFSPSMLMKAHKMLSKNNKMKRLMLSMTSFNNSFGSGSLSAASASSSVPTSSSSSSSSSCSSSSSASSPSSSASSSSSSSSSSPAFPNFPSQLIPALGPPPPLPPPSLMSSPPPPAPTPLPTSSCADEVEGPVLKMLVAKVLVGRYTRGNKDLRKPPPMKEDDPFGRDYDSCVDNVADPAIHVVFDNKQAYPMWIIEYIEEYP